MTLFPINKKGEKAKFAFSPFFILPHTAYSRIIRRLAIKTPLNTNMAPVIKTVVKASPKTMEEASNVMTGLKYI